MAVNCPIDDVASLHMNAGVQLSVLGLDRFISISFIHSVILIVDFRADEWGLTGGAPPLFATQHYRDLLCCGLRLVLP